MGSGRTTGSLWGSTRSGGTETEARWTFCKESRKGTEDGREVQSCVCSGSVSRKRRGGVKEKKEVERKKKKYCEF